MWHVNTACLPVCNSWKFNVYTCRVLGYKSTNFGHICALKDSGSTYMSRKENFCQWMSILAGASSRLRAYRLPSQCHFVHSVAYSITAQIDRPPYLTNLLMYQPSHCLHSASQNLLSIPFCTTNFSKRSFSFSAPTIWNELLTVIRESNTLDTFKFQGLKTHLTSLNYPQHITTSAARRLPAPQIRLDLTTTVHITNSSID